MDHVDIISKESITVVAPWAINIIAIIGFSMIFFLFGCLVYSNKDNKKVSNEKLLKIILCTSTAGLCVFLILGCIAGLFFRVPSGRYKYEATIDEENMTVEEYNEFMKAYSHNYCKDGIYYFEDRVE